MASLCGFESWLLIGYVTLGKLFNFSVLGFPHLYTEDNSETYLLGLL